MRSTKTTLAVVVLAALAGGCGGSTTSTGDTDASTDTTTGGGDAPIAADSPGPPVEASVDSGGGVDSGGCSPACGPYRTCCGGQCVNLDNDPKNCGACGTACSGETTYCDGTCKPSPCGVDGGICPAGPCCGPVCCGAGEICCKDEGPQSGASVCFTPTAQQPSCPQGCAPMCVSDKNVKRDVVPVHGREVLDQLSQVPMATWSYNADDPSVRHLGPMAQDFHAAFGLGATEKAYDPIDAHGVAFASIQALYAMVQNQNARIEKLEAENQRLRSLSASAPACR